MKIFVESRKFIENQMDKNPEWHLGKWIISIFSSGDASSENDFSPLPDRFNILKLQFDDVTEKEKGVVSDNFIFFNENHAKQIHDFIKGISPDSKKMFFVHCDAGVSRSGAVGFILNEYFNKFISDNKIDNESFFMNNDHILPNPLVVRLLKNEIWGPATFAGIEVNDFDFNEEGEREDHIEKI